jgi:hypothetical protein
MTALAATVGIGNIVGVATAITMGGLGAVFWISYFLYRNGGDGSDDSVGNSLELFRFDERNDGHSEPDWSVIVVESN